MDEFEFEIKNYNSKEIYELFSKLETEKDLLHIYRYEAIMKRAIEIAREIKDFNSLDWLENTVKKNHFNPIMKKAQKNKTKGIYATTNKEFKDFLIELGAALSQLERLTDFHIKKSNTNLL